MSQPQFRYNPKTLRYERVRFSVWRTSGAFIAYGCFGFGFFIGLNFLQNYFIESNLEKSLLAENKSLSEYKVFLASQVESTNESLDHLKADEVKLHEKLFEAPVEQETTEVIQSASIINSIEDWDESMNLLNDRFNAVLEKAKVKNSFWGDHLSLDKDDVPTLVNFPSTSPVKELNDQNLVSGFGTRINPFHKRKYHHDGIDIALTKGTEVLATGNGHVISLYISPLEAGFGNYVEIDHGNGLVTRYAHLEKINVVWGQKITQGQVIALSGSSGGSVAPHLHYEVIEYGKSLDPVTYIVEGISAERHQQLALKSKTQNQSLD
jgi:murein DD-endopeptidase MepM/ murein hydrolase activator NlpD